MKSRRQITTIICAVSFVIVCYILFSRNITNFVLFLSIPWSSENENPEFPINEELYCKPGEKVLLLIAVYSGPDQDMERKFIRQNWGAYARTNQRIRLLFFIGISRNDVDERQIEKESKLYHDIIQLNFTDTYKNLTLKSFAVFRWSHTFCKSAKYVLKIDCDMQINLKSLMPVVERGNISDSFQCGRALYNQRPVRTRNHKYGGSNWYIPRELYPKDVWPPYCYGPAYLVTKRIASKIAALDIPKNPFPMDDVYMTGILREMLKEKIREDFLQFDLFHYSKTDTKIVKGSNIITYIKNVWVKDTRAANVTKRSLL